ncbi:FAD linked oxidase N-terminal [Penicillium angulare]|uniref:FAD linked oxidase N-terminal n=1 Tax=Penicillium angulare TaxID=116970 RepID=UPI0025410591|nr:FAD linked oxidase N-terminal [Penicillium angulare]KAJ5287256.1 FAD linked oxidase N-terminal [Penicillium angulare]
MAYLRGLLVALAAAPIVFGQNAAYKTCLRNAVTDGGSVAFPDALLYQEVDVNRYNLNIPVTPAAVTFPTSTDQVAAIVKCAADNGYPVQAKSGGHSYGNYGLGGTDGAIVVDMKNFQQFSMNYTTWHATIGPGTLLEDITTRLYNAGKRAMAHGTSPQIGAGGHFTIGGLGPLSRQFGMALDHTLEVEVVLANGTIVRASESENSDVFWAIRGAGSGFGIVTEFVVRTEPAPGTAVQYEFSISIGDAKSQAALYKQWQAYVSNPDLTWKLASTLWVLQDTMIISGTYFGTKAEYDALDMASQFPGANGTAIVFEDFLGLVAEWGEEIALKLSGGIPSNFYAKSTAWTPQDLMSDTSIDQFFEYVETANKGTLLWLLVFDFEGGFINEIPADATSYPHRDVLIWLQTYSINLLGRVTPTMIKFLDQLNVLANTSAPYEAYAGYVDPLLQNGPQAYWGANLPRLERIKADIDPDNVFSNPQSPQPAS